MAAATLTGFFGTSCGGGSAEARERRVANILAFQATPGPDWTAAANAAFAASSRVYFPAGEYSLNAVNWPANTEIFGDGDSSVLRMPASAHYLFTCDSGSARVDDNISGLYMHDLQLRGTSDVDGFSEFKHLVSLNGVSNVVFRRVLFKGFRGDGLYIGSGNTAGTERHNTGVLVEQCRFDGINNANRNAVSIIDCDGLVVRQNVFENTTSPHMPGAIDIEPDRFDFPIVRNLNIVNNRFRRIGGFTGIIAVSVPATVKSTPSDIVVEGNVSTDAIGSSAFFFFNTHVLPTDDSPTNNVTVHKNSVRSGSMPFLVAGKGFTLSDNVFEDLTHSGCLGFTEANDAVRDVKLLNNLLLRCGATSGAGVSVFKADNLRFAGNRFVDCGAGKPPRLASAVAFRPGRSSGVTFEDNEFSSPTGKTSIAVSTDAEHVLAQATNRFIRNRLGGLALQFLSRGNG